MLKAYKFPTDLYPIFLMNNSNTEEKMEKNIYLLSLLFLISTSTLFAQMGNGNIGSARPGGKISGNVIDATDNKPLEYANIVLFDEETHTMITGTVTNPSGNFSLEKIKPGKYSLEVKFIGYERNVVEEVTLTRGSFHIDLGTIKLTRATYETEEVEVVAEKTVVEYKIDKKVINVGQQATSLSGTAVDALEMSPAIRVDIDGTVSLRGSSSFTLLIDGKPSILDASDALNQLPASAIENIEIITNPSAKYDPEGTSGIINVILKKNELSGFSGMVNLNAGTHENYGGDALFEYRHNGFSANFGFDYSERNRPGNMTSARQTTTNDITTFLNSDGERKHGGKRYGLRGGLSFDLTDSDNLSASFRYGGMDHGHSSDFNYEQWTSVIPDRYLYSSSESSTRDGEYYRISMDYLHKFGPNDHKLYLEANYSSRDGDETSRNDLLDEMNNLTDSKKYIESGPSKNWRFKAEYKLPFNETDYLEAGYNADLDDDDEFNENYEYNFATNQYDFLDLYSHDSKSKEDVHALFGTYTAELGAFGFQIGLRGEYTYRDIELVGENKSFNIDRVDFFPTLHTSYKIDDTFSVMASYSRRIRRPRGFDLEPFETWMDAYNVRVGNPALNPEYINSVEAGFQKHFEKVTFSIESYYRYTTNSIERVTSVYSENVMLHTVANIGKTHALGAELMLTFNPLSFWNINMTGDLYDFRQEGSLLNQSLDNSSFNYGLRMNNRLIFSKTFGSQVDLRWNSPSTTAQGERKGEFIVSASLAYDIIPKDLKAILQVRDIFSTRKWDFTSYGPGFSSSTIMEPNSPFISLTLRYSINNYKNGKDKARDEGMMEEGMSEGGY